MAATKTAAPGAKPNILFIMGDDIGWFNIGAYHRGMMAGRTPNLDRLAADGMLFTPAGLEQATRLVVAARHARRYAAAGWGRHCDSPRPIVSGQMMR